MTSFSDFLLWLRCTSFAAIGIFVVLLVGNLIVGHSVAGVYGPAFYVAALVVPWGALYYRHIKQLPLRNSRLVWALSFLYITLFTYAATIFMVVPSGPLLPKPVFALMVGIALSGVSLFPTPFFQTTKDVTVIRPNNSFKPNPLRSF